MVPASHRLPNSYVYVISVLAPFLSLYCCNRLQCKRSHSPHTVDGTKPYESSVVVLRVHGWSAVKAHASGAVVQGDVWDPNNKRSQTEPRTKTKINVKNGGLIGRE